MIRKISRNEHRQRVHRRIRRKLSGTAETPRLSVFRSSRHIYAQLIDDRLGRTLAAASTVKNGVSLTNGGKLAAAAEIGRLIGERAKEKGIRAAVFDRGGYRYHGRVKALAEASRKAGLEF